jgi:hypothetical protein
VQWEIDELERESERVGEEIRAVRELREAEKRIKR